MNWPRLTVKMVSGEWPPRRRNLGRKYPCRLRAWRKEAGLTQRMLAGLSGVGCSAIANFENARAAPTEESAVRLAEALSRESDLAISVWDIFDEVMDEKDYKTGNMVANR